jgi:hypothetical protein
MTICVLCVSLGVFVFAYNSVRGADETEGNNVPAKQETIKLDGKGRQASDKFNLQSGLALIEISHDGDSNVIVRLLDENGKQIDTLFNQIGNFKGERGFMIPRDGECLADVVADGNWTLAIRQPRPTQGYSVPRTLEGTGYGVTDFIELNKGLKVFKMNHSGQGRFTVNLVDRDGRIVEPLINTLGTFSGSKPVSIEKPGIYFLNVAGDGDWTIQVQ